MLKNKYRNDAIVSRFSILLQSWLLFNKESENIYYGEDNNDNEHNSIKIDIITGVGKFYLKSGTTVAKDILKCSNLWLYKK